MKTTRKWIALLLTFALMIALPGTSVAANADAQTTTDTITVQLKVEDVDSTLVSAQVTLSGEDVAQLSHTFSVESGGVEIPVLTSEMPTAAHTIAKYVADTSDAPRDDLSFSYGSPAHIKGEKPCDFYAYWSFRVNNIAPSDEATGYGYTPDTCPIKDGDSIVFFRQACYDPNAGDWGAYTHYSWFDRNSYETSENTPVAVTYSKDDGFGFGAEPAADETLTVYRNDNEVQTATTDQTGTAHLTFKEAGTYTVVAGKLRDGIPENSHASATVSVTAGAIVPTNTPTSAPTNTPASTPTNTPASAPTNTPTSTPTNAQTAKKPAAPKRLRASVSKKKATLSWKKVSGVKGYQVFVSKKSKNGFKKLTKTSKTKISKKFKKGTYFLKVRSFAILDGKKRYSKYSNTVKVTIRK